MTEVYFLVLCLLIPAALCANPCAPRDYGEETIVCVCNSTYCDDVELPQDDIYHPQVVFQYTTTKSGKRLYYSSHRLRGRIPPGKQHLPKYTVDRSKTYQEIYGFGCAMTGSAGYLFKTLSEDTQENLLSSYFGPEGIRYSILRVPVASSDCSPSNVSCDDVPGDVDLTYFNLSEEDLNYKIPYIKRANELSGAPMRLIGTTWFPSIWMMEYVEDGDYSILNPDYWNTWANYLVKFFDAYAEEGLSFWGLTQMNAPYTAFRTHSIFSLAWTTEEMLEWTVKDLGPVLHANNYGDVKVMILDDDRLQVEEYTDLFYHNKTACDYVHGTAIHWDADRIISSEDEERTTISSDVLDRINEQYPNKFLLYTESPLTTEIRPGPFVILGDWKTTDMYITDIIDVLNHHVRGWIDWSCACNPDGGPSWVNTHAEASIIINSTADEFYKEPSFYALGHLSAFVPPGSHRVHLNVEGDDDGMLQSVAFRKPNGSTVIVVYNKHENDTEILIDEGPYKGRHVAKIEPHSINTFVYH